MWILAPAAAWLLALAALIWFLRSPAGRERPRGMIIVTVVAGLLAFGGIALMGIPGAVIYELCVPWVRLMMGGRFTDLDDGAWPAALIITLAWPASLVVAWVAANGPLRRRGRAVRWTAFIIMAYLAGVLLALWAHLSGLA
ncbi:MAG TPA: hypothetical protein VHG93_25865 [Longimicrobium sp.]|nr:hypothetical protein [Longimicrobium sp.]